MNRTPPQKVRKTLRHEVGFGCPVPGCGNPYLRWHHFDPPWRMKKHHNPAGMIALCGEHHDKADAGAYTKDQLRGFKKNPYAKEREVSGKFEWLRNNTLLVIGGNFFLETHHVLAYQNTPVIWFSRDEDRNILVNVNMIAPSGKKRAVILENFWIEQGEPCDLECPPSGKLLKIDYGNGEFLRVEFHNLTSDKNATRRFSDAWMIAESECPLPITSIEIHYRIPIIGLDMGPKDTKFQPQPPFGFTMQGSFFKQCEPFIYAVDSPRFPAIFGIRTS